MRFGASVSFERSELVANTGRSKDSEGGCFALRDGGVLYVRDTLIANSTAGYGGAIRLYTQEEEAVSVLFDNATFAFNNATFFGNVLAAYTHTRALFSQFTYANNRFNYNIDPDGFRTKTLVRFGFNGNPLLDADRATLAPGGTKLMRSNPSEPLFYTFTLPEDGRLTNQWPFFATGERYAGYYDARTSKGQKAASGGVAYLIRAAMPVSSSNRESEDSDQYRGVCAFKDINAYQNGGGAGGLDACYMHADFDVQQCLDEMQLL
jgi:hypothetical protein